MYACKILGNDFLENIDSWIWGKYTSCFTQVCLKQNIEYISTPKQERNSCSSVTLLSEVQNSSLEKEFRLKAN